MACQIIFNSVLNKNLNGKQITYMNSKCKLVRFRDGRDSYEYGIDLIDWIIDGIEDVFFTIHICCGYPTYLDQKDYHKASSNSYNILSIFYYNRCLKL